MPALILLALLPFTASAEPILDINFDDIPEGRVRALKDVLPHRWLINMDKKLFEVSSDVPRPPSDRPGLTKGLAYSGAGGWPAGDVYIIWPEQVTEGCLEARASVFLPDKRVPVFVGLTRANTANWQDIGPGAIMLSKRKTEVWKSGGFAAISRVGWNHIRLVADLDRRLAYAFVRHESKKKEQMIAWEVPIPPDDKGPRLNALYLRTDLGYSKERAYFADLRVEPCDPPQDGVSHAEADLSHIVAPSEGIDLGGLWDFLPATDGDASSLSPALPAEDADWRRVVVPGEHEPILRAYGTQRAWFRQTVTLPEDWKGKLISVNFGLTRARADIYWNRKFVETHWQGHSGYAVDITDVATPGQENELLVLIHSHRCLTDPEGPLYPLTWTWMYKTGTGICLPVWVEATPALHVADIFARPSVSEDKLRLDVTVANHGNRVGDKTAAQTVEVRGHVLSDGKKVLDLPPAVLSLKRGTSGVVTLEADWSGA